MLINLPIAGIFLEIISYGDRLLVYSVIRDTEDVDNYVGGEIHIKIIKPVGTIETITEGEISALRTSYSLRKDIRRRLDNNWQKIEPKIIQILEEEEATEKQKTTSLLMQENIDNNKKEGLFG